MTTYDTKDLMALGSILREQGNSVFPAEFIGHKALRVSCISRRQAIAACHDAKLLAQGTAVEVTDIQRGDVLTFEFYLLPKF